MFDTLAKTGIAHVIQLSVAPVFLLTSVGAILNVMANRLARIIDRARMLEQKLHGAPEPDRPDLLDRLASLSKRARLISHSFKRHGMVEGLDETFDAVIFVGYHAKADSPR